MGMDLLDVAFRVEKSFGISLEASDFQQLVRDRDIVVGDLYALILRRIRIVKDLVRTVAATDYEAILASSEDGFVGSYNLPADDRCLAVWQQLREILAESLDVKAEEVNLKSLLVADLGAS